MTDDEKRVVELQKEENKIWKLLEKLLNEDEQKKVGELIEINIELESLSNQ